MATVLLTMGLVQDVTYTLRSMGGLRFLAKLVMFFLINRTGSLVSAIRGVTG